MTDVQSSQPALATAEIVHGEIVAAVQIDAPLDRVFAAFTDPHEILKWWGSDDVYRLTEWTPSVDPGGRFHAVGVAKDGASFVIDGEYLELETPHRFVHTWKPDFDGGHISTVACHLESREGGTFLTLTHYDFHGRTEPLERHRLGWERVLMWLATYAEGDDTP